MAALQIGGDVSLFRLLQIQTFECSVCKQLHNEEQLTDTTQQKVLFGAKPWAVCPCCLHSVDRPLIRNRAYRERAKRWMESHKKL